MWYYPILSVQDAVRFNEPHPASIQLYTMKGIESWNDTILIVATTRVM